MRCAGGDVQATFEDGGDCTLTAFDGKFLSLRCDRAFAPGQPIALLVELAGAPHRIDARSLGSKKNDDGAFDVRVRPVNLRRETREALSEALPQR